jgi:hypothetical protein
MNHQLDVTCRDHDHLEQLATPSWAEVKEPVVTDLVDDKGLFDRMSDVFIRNSVLADGWVDVPRISYRETFRARLVCCEPDSGWADR